MFNFPFLGKLFILVVVMCSTSISAWANIPDKEILLRQLDKTIDNASQYDQVKEAAIEQTKNRLALTTDPAIQYALCDSLFEAYKKYQTDSALVYVDRKEALLAIHPQLASIETVKMNRAEEFAVKGLYHEALMTLNHIDRDSLDTHEEQIGYYHQYRSLYGYMADYCPIPREKQFYLDLTNAYRDTLTALHKTANNAAYFLTNTEILIIQGDNKQAIENLLPIFTEHAESDPRYAGLLAYNLAWAYGNLGDTENQIRYLAFSAIQDIRLSIKEYAALPRLAQILFAQGDIDRAYNYLNLSMRDATFSGARLRTVEVSETYPIVNEAYKLKADSNRQTMNLLLGMFVGMILLLIGVSLYIYKNMLRLRKAQQALAKAYDQLQLANDEISRSDRIKQQYLTHYLGLCGTYLDKLENYRRSLANLAIASKINELFKAIKSERFIEEERIKFYRSFDETFLDLFPHFVDEFNALLRENERIYPKPGELLSPELRIFALIRLGITDNNKIALFLRYSLNTIYIYRSKVRNKAINKATFDQDIMNIKQLS